MNPILKKHEIRKKYLNKRLNRTRKDLETASKSILKKLQNLPEYKKAKKVLFYVPIKNEVDTTPLIKQDLKNKGIFLPKIQEDQKISIRQIESLDQLEKGKFNVPEPTSDCHPEKAENLDLVIVPGIAFDKNGLRIGYGKGYYDRFLKKTKCPRVALAYDFQIHENIPGEIHDEKVDLIITDTHTFKT